MCTASRGEPFCVKQDKTLKIPPIWGKAFRVKQEKSRKFLISSA
jgi:hypothetical protein